MYSCMYNHVVPQNIEYMYMCMHLTVHKDLQSFRARVRARATSTVPLVVSICFAMVSGRQSVDI